MIFLHYCRVCKTWYEITRHPVFWKRVVTDISRNHHSSVSAAALNLAEILPPCISYLELNFDDTRDRRHFELRKLSSLLRARCPNLEAIVLRHVNLVYHRPATMDLSNQLPENIRVFVLHNKRRMEKLALYFSDSDISKMEVLDLRRCNEMFIRPFFRSPLPRLKKLRLANSAMRDGELASILFPVMKQIEVLDLEDTIAASITFDTIRMYGFHLTELYLCNTLLCNSGVLISDEKENALQQLKVICLRNCAVVRKNIESLIKHCRSLERIYVGGLWGYFDFEENYSRFMSKSKIVQLDFDTKYCNHGDKINYMHE